MMTKEQYEAWTSWFRRNPGSIRVLRGINDGLTYLCYLLYPALLAYSALYRQDLLLKMVLVPGIAFVAVSLFRRVFDAPRPYEALDIDPIIKKATSGRSFPSRHIFSVFMIAMCYLRVCVPLGCALCVCGAVMAVIRVLGGVHYPKDVIAGAVVAIVCGAIGLWLVP